MKYIRTKDGIMAFTNLPYDVDDAGNQSYQGMRVADTIEDLCDEFIEVWGDNGEFHWYITRKELKRWKTDNSEIYGAMWTKNGLVFVAKRNAEKELELL